MTAHDREYTALFPFCGLGAGALGFQRAAIRLFGEDVRFRNLGGIDIDPDACADFEYLTGARALCADISKLTPAELRAFAGIVPPDIVSTSSPCKGASGLLPEEKAKTAPYQALNRLSLDFAELMVSTWDLPPKLLLFENVPRIETRAKAMLATLRAILRKAGYLLHEGSHECGELGGLAQIRRRYLMVARHPDRCPPLLYQPPRKRVRGCGELLGELPMPNDPAAGPMHELPAIGWLNWVRLAMIPAGGDWRDISGVLAEGQARREKFRRHRVEHWGEPSATVGGPGSNGVENVADPRVRCAPRAGAYGITGWDEASKTVTGSADVDNSPVSVADPRVTGDAGAEYFRGTLGVVRWEEPTGVVTGAASPARGRFSVADPRMTRGPNAHDNNLTVAALEGPAHTITGSTRPGSGAPSVADPRIGLGDPVVGRAYDHGYAVLPWAKPSFTVAAGSHPGQGAYSVADPRSKRAQCHLGGLLPFEEAERTLIGGDMPIPFAIVGPDGIPRMVIQAHTGRLDGIPVILARDGTWHRPMTSLELAVLQGLPPIVNGQPLRLAGSSTAAWRERIGNAEPVGTMQAIAEQMLVALASGEAGTFSLSGAGGVWVAPRADGAAEADRGS